MLRLIPFLFLILPVIEIALFIVIGGRIGVLATLAWVLAMAVIGILVIRVKGLKTARHANHAMRRGETPGPAMMDGALTVVAAVLLIVPGFASDLIGLILLLPPVRAYLVSKVRWQQFGSFTFTAGTTRRERSGVFDLDPDDYERRDPEGPDWRKPRLPKDRDPDL